MEKEQLPLNHLRCNSCKEVKNIKKFYVYNPRWCKFCLCEANKKAYMTRKYNLYKKGYAKINTKKQPVKDYTLNYIFNSAISSAKKRGIEFKISIEDIYNIYEKQAHRCSLTGIELTFQPFEDTKVSIDRIDSSKGYFKDNIQLVCSTVNLMKLDHDQQDFIEWCGKVHFHSVKTH